MVSKLLDRSTTTCSSSRRVFRLAPGYIWRTTRLHTRSTSVSGILQRQGSILGPLLFLVYCNDVQNYIQANSTLALFADDSKLYRSLDLPNASKSLQHDLDSLQKWSVDMKMVFNTTKCKVMHFSKKKLKTQTSYKLNGQQLEQVTHISDLGITVSSDLSWFKHIENIAAKANKTLGRIKRISKGITDFFTRILLFCTLVRPKLTMFTYTNFERVKRTTEF